MKTEILQIHERAHRPSNEATPNWFFKPCFAHCQVTWHSIEWWKLNSQAELCHLVLDLGWLSHLPHWGYLPFSEESVPGALRTPCLIFVIDKHLNPNSSLSIMPKNPNKQRVNPIKVTCVTWMTKDSEHGSKGQLIKLKSEATPTSKSCSATSSPSNVPTSSKQIRSTLQALFDEGFDSPDFGCTPVKPIWIPHTKVIFIIFFMN